MTVVMRLVADIFGPTSADDSDGSLWRSIM